MITATRYHDISCGHRVVGHENKCALLHGHNYRIHFTLEAPQLDSVGRVLDFGVIKSTLCDWLEDNWDHKFLAWEKDTDLCDLSIRAQPQGNLFASSIVWVPFNPTAENMARYLLHTVGPHLLEEVQLVQVIVEETRKCSAMATL